MTKLKYLTLIILSVLSIGTKTLHGSSIEDNSLAIKTISERLVADCYDNRSFFNFLGVKDRDLENAALFVKSQLEDGSWSDINYDDNGNAWNPLRHLNRLVAIAYEYKAPHGSLHGDKDVLDGVQKGLDYWFEKSPTCYNWYKHKITLPRYMGVLALLLKDDIKSSTLDKMLETISSKQEYAYTDRIRSAQSTLYKGVVLQDEQIITNAIKAIASVIEQTTKDVGIQYDWSFRYHDGHLYTGAYGNAMLDNLLGMYPYFIGTSLDLSSDQFNILNNFLAQGLSPIVYGDLIDYNTIGRQIAVANAWNVTTYIPAFEMFIGATKENRKLYKEMIDGVNSGKKQSLTGNFLYWCSDFSLQRSKNFYTSVRVGSSRNGNNTECINGENMYGEWCCYGLNFIMVDGDEYEGIFPVWDWKSLPGVTAPDSIQRGKGWYSHDSEFVGGASNGEIGNLTMDLNYCQTKAHKSWFFFEKGYIALGSSIESELDKEIHTTINQTLRDGEIVIDGKRYSEDMEFHSKISYIWHDKVTYILPEESSVHITSKKQSGSVSDIFTYGSKDIISKDLLTMRFEHGIKPKDGSYSYIIVPNTTTKQAEKLANKQPIKILTNSHNLHAVEEVKSGTIQAIFHSPGTLNLHSGTSICVDKPCAVIIEKGGDIWISEPTKRAKEITIEYKSNANKSYKRSIALPQGKYLGSSIKIDIK